MSPSGPLQPEGISSARLRFGHVSITRPSHCYSMATHCFVPGGIIRKVRDGFAGIFVAWASCPCSRYPAISTGTPIESAKPKRSFPAFSARPKDRCAVAFLSRVPANAVEYHGHGQDAHAILQCTPKVTRTGIRSGGGGLAPIPRWVVLPRSKPPNAVARYRECPARFRDIHLCFFDEHEHCGDPHVRFGYGRILIF